MCQIDEEWQDFNNWYCRHGYYTGLACPDCSTSSPVEVLENVDPGDDNDYV